MFNILIACLLFMIIFILLFALHDIVSVPNIVYGEVAKKLNICGGPLDTDMVGF